MLIQNSWKNLIEFTYIGNTSEDYKLNNTTIIPPLAGKELAEELKKHHIYITASINEPSKSPYRSSSMWFAYFVFRKWGNTRILLWFRSWI